MTNLLFKGSQSVCSGRQGEQITPCHNSRTKLRMKLLNVEKQDNIEFYLSCKFQPSTFNVRCKTDVTDGMPDKQTNKRTNYYGARTMPQFVLSIYAKVDLRFDFRLSIRFLIRSWIVKSIVDSIFDCRFDLQLV